MFRKTDARDLGRWLLPGQYKLVGCLIFFFCTSIIGGCGTTNTAATQAKTQPQPTITVSPFHTTVQTFDKDFTVTLTIAPDRSGTNIFTMQVVDRAGKLANHVEITLYTTMQDMAMGTDSVVLQAVGAGRFRATSNVLSMGGRWAIGIAIQTDDHVVHKAGVSFTVPL